MAGDGKGIIIVKKLGKFEFAKYHALGNDYIVVDERGFGVRFTPDNIRRICHRNLGVGSDGILAFRPLPGGAFNLRIFNPDGSEAEKSGNGLRIFARFAWDLGYVRKRDFPVKTLGGDVRAELFLKRGDVDVIRVEMGRATFVSREIPVAGPRREVVGEVFRAGGRNFRATCLSVGNPHCVIFMGRLDVGELRRYGPLLENHAAFPNRINVQFARVRSRHVIDALIWERGAGETMASGSSSCAVAAAAVKNGLADGTVKIRMPGGIIRVDVGRDFPCA